MPANGAARVTLQASTAQAEANCYPFDTLPALVIKSFPEELHARLRQIAASHRRSVTQETIHLIELAISIENNTAFPVEAGVSKRANRDLLPPYKAMSKTGAFSRGKDWSIALSKERDV